MIGRTLLAGARAGFGLLVDDGAIALGVVVAVVVAAALAGPLGGGEIVGWALFALFWTAMGISVRRHRRRQN